MKKVLLILVAAFCVQSVQASVMQAVRKVGLYASIAGLGTCAMVVSAANIGLATLFGKQIVDEARGTKRPTNIGLSAAGMVVTGGVGAWILKRTVPGLVLTAREAKNELSPVVKRVVQKLASTLRKVK